MIDEAQFFSRTETDIGVVLNAVQKEAVLKTEGPLLLLASPGSGKTTTMIMRIGYLIKVKQVPSHKIKAVTFSKASARDMTARFQHFFPDLTVVDFSTIHSLAFEIVRNYLSQHQIAYQLIEGYVEPRFLHKKQILRRLYQTYNDEVITDDQLEELISTISFIKNKLYQEADWEQVDCTVRHYVEIIRDYEKFKERGTSTLLLDYDDMLTKAYDILGNDAAVLSNYQQRYEYVLTDESQDTSLVQHKIIELLVKKHRNLCVVADDDQSIYTWRAAEPQYLLDFKKVYPEADIMMMEQNYRSKREIVSVSNQFIKRNKNRYDKNMFTENKAEGEIHIRLLPDHTSQTNYVIQAIKGAEAYQDVAILYRNNHCAIILYDALEREGIPFYTKDTDSHFFSHWVVQDILNFMRLIHSPHRADILERIHTKFNGYVSKQQLSNLSGCPKDSTVFQELQRISDLKPYQVRNFKKCDRLFKEMRSMRPEQIIKTIRYDLDYQKRLSEMSKQLGFNFDYLLTVLQTLEDIAEREATMEDFARRIHRLQDVLKQANQAKNAVTFSTFHSAKGLEFEKVYMIDLIEGVIPASTDESQSQLEEAVRLFYVGMTRAKSHLELLTYKAKHRKDVKTSRFLQDIYQIMNPDETLEESSKQSAYKKVKNRETLNPNAITDANELKAGIDIKHRVFGRGTITAISNHDIKIQFTKQEKLLSMTTCLEMGLLEHV